MSKQLNILYVDDDDKTRQTVKSQMESDWNIDVAATPTEGKNALSSTKYDCVVFTSEFESSSGINFYNTIDDDFQDITFILFGSSPDVGEIQSAYRHGIDDVVIKPQSRETDGGGSVTQAEPQQKKSKNEFNSVEDGVEILQNRISTLLLDREVDIEQTVFSSITSLLGAADDELELKIDFALESLGESLDANRCIIYDYDDSDEKPVYRQKNDWCADGTNCDTQEPVIGDEKIDTGELPGHEENIQNFNIFCRDLTSGSSTPIKQSITEDISQEFIGNLIIIPLVSDWQLQSIIVITTKYPRAWGESLRQQIKTLGEVITNTKKRKEDRKQLQKQNQRLEEFTSVVSHDLQNPLSIAKGYVDLAMEAEDVGHLGEASDAIHRMETMIDELLTLARQGESIGETTTIAVVDVVDDAWNGIDTKEAELVTDGVESIPEQEADVSRLQEVFENLFKNAIDHAGEDVTITVRDIDEGIAIGDDGNGIPDDEIDQIFDRGYTGGNGTGFGLAIVEEIVNAHDWSIKVGESDMGGAEFRILFK